jgi:hypothetical protein
VIKGRRSRRFYELADRLLKDEVALSRMKSSDPLDGQTADLQLRIRAAREAMASFAEVEA